MNFALPVLTIGLGSLQLRPTRGFYPSTGVDPNASQSIVADSVLEELHTDQLEITEHPVELGAPVADHSFKRPAEVRISCVWSNSPRNSSGPLGTAIAAATGTGIGSIAAAAAGTLTAVQSLLSGDGVQQARAIYQQLLDLQASRIPFTIYTGKRKYDNMLFKTLTVTTDRKSENVLQLTAICRQVIIVSTTTVQLPVNVSATSVPWNAAPVNGGQKQLLNAPLGSGFFGV